MVSYEDFQKLEIKVGKVLDVEDHPNADKLYLIKVDTGEERRLVAGIRNDYSKEDLIGKKIIVLCNLEQMKIRGVLSEGMLLAAQDDKVSLLTVDKDVKEGSKIS
ncbi:MAG: hypothetical protein KJ674_05425 [Nanoarchaeota archaeon]|nr:hypothetical protein [Nanoarchaeota archaeon]